MDDVEEFTPKDLEVLPNKIVHDILHYGITRDSSLNGYSGDITLGVSRDSKKYSPKNRKFKKESLCSMNRVASLFVLYISTIAESIAKGNKRSTVYDRDILEALRQCMFWEVETQIADSENQVLESSLPKNGEKPDVENDMEMDDEDDNFDNDLEDDVEIEEDDDDPNAEVEDSTGPLAKPSEQNEYEDLESYGEKGLDPAQSGDPPSDQSGNPDESLDNSMMSEENNDLYPYKLL